MTKYVNRLGHPWIFIHDGKTYRLSSGINILPDDISHPQLKRLIPKSIPTPEHTVTHTHVSGRVSANKQEELPTIDKIVIPKKLIQKKKVSSTVKKSKSKNKKR